MDNLTRRSGRVGSGRVGSGKVGLGLKIYKNMQVWLGRVEKSQKRSEGQVVASIQQELANYKTQKSATVLAAADDRIHHNVRDCAKSPMHQCEFGAVRERLFVVGWQPYY